MRIQKLAYNNDRLTESSEGQLAGELMNQAVSVLILVRIVAFVSNVPVDQGIARRFTCRSAGDLRTGSYSGKRSTAGHMLH